MRKQEYRPTYNVPALDKGLDILETLATKRVPLTQVQIARALDKGASEVFRMLDCLEKRLYIEKDPISGAYRLTLRLFELSHTHSPFQQLVQTAARPMRELADKVSESCHLSVLHRGELLVLAQEESPEKVRISIEVGSTFSAVRTVSGRLLLAHLSSQDLPEALALDSHFASLSAKDKTAFHRQLIRIRSRSFEAAHSATNEGVFDLAVLVGTRTSSLQAALAIPSTTPESSKARRDRLLLPLRRCAETITRLVGLV